jgi:hypothetical protein
MKFNKGQILKNGGSSWFALGRQCSSWESFSPPVRYRQPWLRLRYSPDCGCAHHSGWPKANDNL